jgi:hypothetical protein
MNPARWFKARVDDAIAAGRDGLHRRDEMAA